MYYMYVLSWGRGPGLLVMNTTAKTTVVVMTKKKLAMAMIKESKRECVVSSVPIAILAYIYIYFLSG